jgi:hypothetical protein
MERLFHPLWLGLTALLLSSGASAASQLVAGVAYEHGSYAGDAYHVLRVDLGQVSVIPYHSPTVRRVDHMIPDVQARLPPGEEVVAAINSGFFFNGQSYSRTITPWGVAPALRASMFAGRTTPRHIQLARRMQARSELHLVGNQAWIVPAETGADRQLVSRGIYVMGGGGALLPPPPVSLRIANANLRPDPNATGDTSRTAAALDSRDRSVLFLVTVDKRPGSGMNLAQLANLLRNLRFAGRPLYLDEAMTFDSGGSTTMWLKGAGLVSYNELDRTTGRMGVRAVMSGLMVVAHRTTPTPPSPTPTPRSCDPDAPPTGPSCHDWYRFGECRRLRGRSDPTEMALLQNMANRHGQAMAFLAGYHGSPDLRTSCGP